jgi:hypothetical protein
MRDTRGLNCLSTSNNRPDALLTVAPDDTLDIVDNHDYATDLEPTPPDADAGVQLDLPAANGCTLLPTSTRPANQMHAWVSRPVNPDGLYALKGGTTLKLWTKSINDVQISGKLCAVVFQRTETYATSATTTPVTVDTPIATSTSSKATWPSGTWEELNMPMQFTPFNIPAVATSFPKSYTRIGVAIGLDRAGGNSNQFEFQYDTVRFESRLEVETTTPID